MKRQTKAKKPRTLNAVWADARCFLFAKSGKRGVSVSVQTALTTKQALRLSAWLAEAAEWKADE